MYTQARRREQESEGGSKAEQRRVGEAYQLYQIGAYKCTSVSWCAPANNIIRDRSLSPSLSLPLSLVSFRHRVAAPPAITRARVASATTSLRIRAGRRHTATLLPSHAHMRIYVYIYTRIYTRVYIVASLAWFSPVWTNHGASRARRAPPPRPTCYHFSLGARSSIAATV